jgi:hypothetical protein
MTSRAETSSARRASGQAFAYSTVRKTSDEPPRLIPVRSWIDPPLQGLAGAASSPVSVFR